MDIFEIACRGQQLMMKEILRQIEELRVDSAEKGKALIEYMKNTMREEGEESPAALATNIKIREEGGRRMGLYQAMKIIEEVWGTQDSSYKIGIDMAEGKDKTVYK